MFETISEFFRNSLGLMIFFAIFAFGMIFTLFSLIFGGEHDGGDHGDIHGDAHGDGDDNQAPGFFSIRGISLFATGFGALGFIVMYYTEKVLLASVSGLGFGWVFAFLGLFMMRMLIRQQANSMMRPEEMIGTLGEVTTGIPDHGVGEVRMTVDGVTLTRTASSTSGTAIRSGTIVRVVRSDGGTVSVEEFPQ